VHIKRHRTPLVEGKLLKIIDKSRKKTLHIFLTWDAYAPYAPCMATPLLLVKTAMMNILFTILLTIALISFFCIIRITRLFTGLSLVESQPFQIVAEIFTKRSLFGKLKQTRRQKVG